MEMHETSRLIEDEMQKMQDAMQHKQIELDTLKTESEAKLMALESELKKATAC